jgi:hypothetical protein
VATLVAQPPTLATASKAPHEKETKTLNTNLRAAARDFDRFPIAASARLMRGRYYGTFIRFAQFNSDRVYEMARKAVERHNRGAKLGGAA